MNNINDFAKQKRMHIKLINDCDSVTSFNTINSRLTKLNVHLHNLKKYILQFPSKTSVKTSVCTTILSSIIIRMNFTNRGVINDNKFHISTTMLAIMHRREFNECSYRRTQPSGKFWKFNQL